MNGCIITQNDRVVKGKRNADFGTFFVENLTIPAFVLTFRPKQGIIEKPKKGNGYRMKTLSISVAAYNMENLIRQNLDSFVLSPAAPEIEVLVINDGSTDGTAQIVREYEKKYPDTIRLIDQPNAGPGSTVNRGMEQATGKYFRMVDADDWVGEGFADYVQVLQETDADLVLTDYVCVDDKTGQERFCPVEGIEAGKVFPFRSASVSLCPPMHSVTWKTELLQRNGIRLFNGFYTDIQYLLFPVPYVETVLYVNRTVYMYRVSLSGQSVSVASMQRNLPMHDSVLFSLTELYSRIREENPAAADYILRRTVLVAGAQMSTLLSFPPSGERKRDLYAFLDRLQRECPEVYRVFSKLKTVRVLRLGGGLFYRLVSHLHRRRLGLEG